VIKGITFTLDEGEVLTIVGPNGSGKTTLLKAILSLIPLRSGSITLFGKDISEVDTERMLAYIPQRLEYERTYPITLREMLSLSLKDANIDKFADILEIRKLLDKKVGELSGGQFQRALLTYALMKEPRLLVMDEPTSWMDVKGADCVLCAVEEFRHKGIAVIFVSHDIEVARSISTIVLGIGNDDYFIDKASSPGLTERLALLFGTRHHNVCSIGGQGGKVIC